MYAGSSENADKTDDTTASSSTSDPVLALIHQYPENMAVDGSAPLTEEDLLGRLLATLPVALFTKHHQEIGLQAAQIISDAEEPLSILKQLSQNFPRYATPLARQVTVDEELAEEVESNQAIARGGTSVAWLNGVQLTEKDMNPFAYVPAQERFTALY